MKIDVIIYMWYKFCLDSVMRPLLDTITAFRTLNNFANNHNITQVGILMSMGRTGCLYTSSRRLEKPRLL